MYSLRSLICYNLLISKNHLEMAHSSFVVNSFSRQYGIKLRNLRQLKDNIVWAIIACREPIQTFHAAIGLIIHYEIVLFLKIFNISLIFKLILNHTRHVCTYLNPNIVMKFNYCDIFSIFFETFRPVVCLRLPRGKFKISWKHLKMCIHSNMS